MPSSPHFVCSRGSRGLQGRMEGVISWKRRCFLLVAILCIQSAYTFLYPTHERRPFARTGAFGPPTKQWKSTSSTNAVESDREKWSSAQCLDEFPELYYEIDRAVNYWKYEQRHTITPDDVEISWRNDGALCILIHDNELRSPDERDVCRKGLPHADALSSEELLQR